MDSSSQKGVTEGQVTTLGTMAPWSLGVRGWQVSTESTPGIGASAEALRRGWLSYSRMLAGTAGPNLQKRAPGSLPSTERVCSFQVGLFLLFQGKNSTFPCGLICFCLWLQKAELNAVLPHLILSTSLQGWRHFPHFTQVQKGLVTCPQSYNQQMSALEFRFAHLCLYQSF